MGVYDSHLCRPQKKRERNRDKDNFCAQHLHTFNSFDTNNCAVCRCIYVLLFMVGEAKFVSRSYCIEFVTSFSHWQVCYEVRIDSDQPTDHLENEPNPNVLRLGWSIAERLHFFSHSWAGNYRVSTMCRQCVVTTVLKLYCFQLCFVFAAFLLLNTDSFSVLLVGFFLIWLSLKLHFFNTHQCSSVFQSQSSLVSLPSHSHLSQFLPCVPCVNLRLTVSLP